MDVWPLDLTGYEGFDERRICLALGAELASMGWTVQHEAPLGRVGRMDIFAQDGAGHYLVIEVKAKSAGPSAIRQLERYLRAVLWSGIGGHVIGVLVAPRLARTVTDMPPGIVFQPVSLTWYHPKAK